MSESSSTSSAGVCNTNKTPEKKKQIAPSKNWCFTWNNYPENWKPYFSSNKIDKYVIGREVGELGTPHLQGYICFKSKVRPLSVIKDKTIHWEKTRKVQESIKYCMKDGDFEVKNIRVEKPLKILQDDQLYDWQKDIIQILKKEPDDRKIYWFWDRKGGIGKSVFTKKICYEYGALLLVGKSADMKHGIVEYKKAEYVFPEIVIMDLPRSFNKSYLSYTGIEEVKNGLFFSGKYEGRMCLFNSPTLIVFSNEEPDYTKLSEDRYVVKEVLPQPLSD